MIKFLGLVATFAFFHSSAWADVLMVRADERVRVLYPAGDTIVSRSCGPDVVVETADRNCASQETFRVDRATYLNRLQTLERIPARFNRPDGLVVTSRRLEWLHRQLAENDLDDSAKRTVEAEIAEVTPVQRKQTAIWRMMDAIAAPEPEQVHVRIHRERYFLYRDALWDVWLAPNGNLWSVGSEAATCYQAAAQCPAPWRVVSIEDFDTAALRAFLNAPISRAIQSRGNGWSTYCLQNVNGPLSSTLSLWLRMEYGSWRMIYYMMDMHTPLPVYCIR